MSEELLEAFDLKATIVFEKTWDAIHAVNADGTRKYRYIIEEGSSRSSKTFSIIDCLDLYARSNDNKRLTVWRDTKTDCKKTVLNDIKKHLKNTNRWKVEHDFNISESILSYTDNSTFEIHGTDDEETVHGLSQDVIWLNEPYNISKDTFDQLDQRCSDFVLIDWNPKRNHWIEDLKKDPRTIVIHSTFRDNPFCPEEQRVKILSYQPVSFCFLVTSGALITQDAKEYDIASNPQGFDNKHLKELSRCRENEYKNSANAFKWSVYGLGLKAERPNRIFSWTEIPYDEYAKIDTKEYYGCDWGKSDAWGVLKAKYYDGCLYLHELNYESENSMRSRLTPTELQLVNSENEGIVQWLFKKLNIPKNEVIICDNNRLEKIAMLRRCGYDEAYPAAKGSGSIMAGIDLLDNLNVFYTKESVNLKYENENYSYVVDKYGVVTDEPEDANNHLHDPARYIALFLQSIGVINKV